MIARQNVQTFLDDFFTKYRVFNILFNDYRKKNSTALLNLEISTAQRKAIIESIVVKDYCQGPLDDNLYGISSMWVFGKIYKDKEIYIKISLGRFNSSVICISFHEAEHKLEYSFK